ncbi:MAG TPA: DUF11 domain-containing protein [Thermoanaerobaculia bacterium]|nr:DUF11 domain-containing protein [Thermoanaerobaculia bacterium]
MKKLLLLVLLLVVCPLVFAQEPPDPEVPAADLSVMKSGPATAAADTDVTYTVTVTNIGELDAASVEVTDPVPDGMTFVSASPAPAGFTCGESEGLVSCFAPLLASGASATFTFVFHIDAQNPPGSEFTNIATATTETIDGNEENNSATAVTVIPTTTTDVGVSKTGPGSAGPDTNVVYTIVVTNFGSIAATNVTMSDTLPADMTFVSLAQSGTSFTCTTPAAGAPGTIQCSIASMEPGESETFTLTAHTPADPGKIPERTNEATVTSDADPNEENNASATTLTISQVDIAVTKSGPSSANAGADIAYTITITNTGPEAATDVTFNDILPSNTTFVSLTYVSGKVATSCTGASCIFGVLALNESSTYSIVLRAGDTTSITNVVTAATASFDTDTSDNASGITTSITPQADLAVTKNGASALTAGNNITYTVAVTNNGPSTAQNVVLTDTLPAGTTFVSVNQTSGPTFTCGQASNVVTCTRATMAPATTANFSIVAAVALSTTGSITNTADVTATTADPNTNNNRATSIASVAVPPADLSITKTASAGDAFVGSNVIYTVTVRNNGPGPADNVVVTDALPANTSLVSAPGCTGTTVLTCNAGTLAPGAQQSFLITVKLPSAPQSVSNTATVTSTTADTTTGNNTSTAVVNAVAIPAGIPTLSEWGLLLLAAALAVIALKPPAT